MVIPEYTAESVDAAIRDHIFKKSFTARELFEALERSTEAMKRREIVATELRRVADAVEKGAEIIEFIVEPTHFLDNKKVDSRIVIAIAE